MGNLTGTPFLPAVTKQIEKRQEFLGVNPKQDKHIIWQNNKSAFLRLASSVNIEDDYKVLGGHFSSFNEAENFLKEAKLQQKADADLTPEAIEYIPAITILTQRSLPASLVGNKLAQSAILFGGVNKLQNSPILVTNPPTDNYNPLFPQGVFSGDSLNIETTFGSAYGWGGTQQGLRPMPGINSADISYYNRGALQKVNINCKVFSVEQLQVFDLLYFKIGYSMLLEWGHNIYIDNKGDLQNRDNYFTDPFNLFFGTGTVQTNSGLSKQNQILETIKTEREKSAYNYDAMLGKLTNFSWKFNADGSYDITLNLIGLGDVIESLKVNQAISIPGAPKAPSVTIAEEGRQIADQQRASEALIAAKRKTLENKQNALGSAQETAQSGSEERDKKWQQIYNEIPDFNKLTFFGNPPKDEPNSQKLERQWILFKNRASVEKISTDELNNIELASFKDPTSNEANALINTEVPSTKLFPKNTIYFTWDGTPQGEVTIDSSSTLKISTFENKQLLKSLVTTGYVSPQGNFTTGPTSAKYDGGGYQIFKTSGTNNYQINFYGLFPNYANRYIELIKLNHQTKGEEAENKKLEGAGAALDAESTALDAEADKREQFFRDLTRDVEAKKERQELAPEAAKESASKTKLNAILWGWIDYLNQVGDYDKNNFSKVEYKAKSSNSGETGVSEHQFTQYYVRFGYLLDWISGNLLYYDLNPIITEKGTNFPKKGSPEYEKLSPEEKQKAHNAEKAAEQPVNNEKQPDTKAQQSNLYKDKIAPLPSNAVPLFTIDTDPETNFCLAWRFQISADPFTCLIPMDGVDNKGNGWKFFTDEKSKINLSSYFFNVNNNKPRNRFKGKVMNIMVNIDFLAKTLIGNVDVNGKVNLLAYLNSICNNINDTLGNVNKLQAIYDSEENQVKIIDDNILKREQEESDAIAVFESFGVTLPSGINATNGASNIIPGKGSFLRGIDFQVQLPPNMAAMATISAQAKGNIVGENATALSKLNDGIKDRIITYKLDAESLGAKAKGQSDSPEVIFQANMRKMYDIIKELYVDFLYQKDNVDTLRSINRDVSLYIIGHYAEKEIAPAPFFIPFNLSLEMDGLSGMVNYQRFAIQESILPYSYRPLISAGGTRNEGVIDFLIKGISHKIANNEWTTKIDSLSVSAKGHSRTATYNIAQEEKFIDLSFLGNTAQKPST